MVAKKLNQVLQEVAAARNILITCGSVDIDGHAFCLGVERLMRSCDVPLDLQRLIHSVTYLIRGAIFRPRRRGRVSNEVCSLSELIDMYHTHEATLHSDKVYALLGISSDGFLNTDLSPNYDVPWQVLFETLIRHALGKEISVDNPPEMEFAKIEGGGYILGRVFSTQAGTTWDGRQSITITWRRIPGTTITTENWNRHWELQPSAKQIMKGDAVCLFKGASRPTIIRFCGDRGAVIVIAVTPPHIIQAGSEDVQWSDCLQKVNRLCTRNLQCIWDWNKLPGKVPSQEGNVASRGCLEQIKESWNSALVLGDLEEYKQGETKFQEAMKYYEMASQKECVVEFSAGPLSFTNSADLDWMNKNYGQPPLLWAAESGYTSVVQLLIARLNVDIGFTDNLGQTAVQLAAAKGHLQVVERLLQEGADVNAAAAITSGRTALRAAAEGGHLTVVERLLQEGADVNAAAGTFDGRTSLQAAAGGGHLTVVERLLQEGADVNAAAAASNGRTALQAAAAGGYLTVVERLLQEGADVNAAAGTFDGRTSLQAAAGGGHLIVVERLLQEGANVNAAAAAGNGRTALQAAAGGSHPEVVDRLLQEGADVNAAAAGNGRTALQAAAAGGHLTVVERLLQEGADVNAAVAFDGRTAIQAAAAGGHLTVVERLLQEGADVNAAAAEYGRTALQAAAEGGHLAVVERLLQEGADVNAAAARYGKTALQAAAGGGHLAVVERLLQEGADVNTKAQLLYGRTALQLAARGGHLAIVELLKPFASL
jgi:ankyrin repeat protein